MRCHSARLSASLNGSSRSKAKRRFRPGAMSQAICAASIAIVPEPQHGSCSAPPASGVPRQPAAASIAAASVSFSGASPLSSRQPRLNSGSPELSTYSEARSGPRCSSSGRSGWRVSTLGRSPWLSRSASQTASLTRSATKFRLRSGLRVAVVSTRSVCAGVIHCVQSTERAERVQVVLAAIRAFGDLDQHALGEPAFEVEPHHLGRPAIESDAAAADAQRAAREGCGRARRRGSGSTPAAHGRNSGRVIGDPGAAGGASHRLAQVGRRDLQRLAVFGHGAARHLDALFLEHVRELAVRQRLGRDPRRRRAA